MPFIAGYLFFRIESMVEHMAPPCVWFLAIPWGPWCVWFLATNHGGQAMVRMVYSHGDHGLTMTNVTISSGSPDTPLEARFTE